MSSTRLSSRPISVSDDIFIVLQGSQNDNVIERPMFMPDVTFRGFFACFLSISLQNQAVKPLLFATHGGSLPLADALCGLWHKQDSNSGLKITKNVFINLK